MNQSEKPRVVVIGGGTGTHTLLTGLKRYADTLDITAVVSMADSGGSTGRLRDEFGYLPVGDVRMALTALARDSHEYSDILRKLFLYRFDRGEGLSGHSLGNLFLIALTDVLGSEEDAIYAASQVLATCGAVIPVTTESVHLVATYQDGKMTMGQSRIDTGKDADRNDTIQELSLNKNATANPNALRAIHDADIIVLGPGDFYTSILANCVVVGIPEALSTTKAKLVYVANLMSRNAQTNSMGTHEYLNEVRRYVKRMPEYIVVNTTPLRDDLVAHYAREGEHPVEHTYVGSETEAILGDFVAREDVVLAKGDVLKRSLIRHDSEKLAQAIVALI